jgi:hypothetical protein
MTRKGAVDQTFIDEPDPHTSLASSFNLHSSLSGASSIPAEANSSGFGSSGFFGPIQGPHISAPVQGMNILRTVRTGTHHHHHHRGPHHLRNALSPSLSSTGSSSNGGLASPAKEPEKAKDESESTKKRRRSVSAGKERKPVMTRGTTSRGNAGKTDAMVAMEWNDNVEVRFAACTADRNRDLTGYLSHRPLPAVHPQQGQPLVQRERRRRALRLAQQISFGHARPQLGQRLAHAGRSLGLVPLGRRRR